MAVKHFILAAALLLCADLAAEPQASLFPKPGKPVPIRDPFTPSRLMFDAAGARPGNGEYGFVPSSQGMQIPKMKLRGLIHQNSDEFIALLEIADVGTFMVREGDEFNIDPSHPQNAIRIEKITRLSVTVETGQLGSIRVLR